ncbi:MAG: hypothetical protein ABWX65_03720 [Mycetocola sp.]
MAALLLTVAATAVVSGCATPASIEASSSPSATSSPASQTPTPSATATPTPTPTPTPEALPAIDDGLISGENLCIALDAADLDPLAPVGVTNASTLSVDQPGDNARCYVSDAPKSTSVFIDYAPNLAGTEKWLTKDWPGPCIGDQRADIITMGGYETALGYCTEYTLSGDRSQRHYSAIATSPGGGVGCTMSWSGSQPYIAPDVMNAICIQVFERLNGTATS